MKVCIFGLDIASGISDDRVRGGAELQMSLLARAISSFGIPVVVIDPVARKDLHVGDNLRIEAVPDWNGGVRGVRLFRYRLPGIVRKLKSTGADLYYTRGFSFYYLLPLCVAKLTGARFVTAVASDIELEGVRSRYVKSYRKDLSWWKMLSTIIPNEIGMWIVRRYSDFIFVQHTGQDRLAKLRYRTPVVRMNNIVDSVLFDITPGGTRTNIVLVGAISKRKNLDVLVPIVKELADVVFEFVGEVQDDVGEKVRKELSQCANVIIHGSLGRAETLAIIARGKALVNTSKIEGFPNAFLEAWALETPVISLHVDPGGVIQQYQLGYCCHGDVALFARLLRQGDYHLDKKSIKQFVLENHSSSMIKPTLDRLLEGQRWS